MLLYNIDFIQAEYIILLNLFIEFYRIYLLLVLIGIHFCSMFTYINVCLDKSNEAIYLIYFGIFK